MTKEPIQFVFEGEIGPDDPVPVDPTRGGDKPGEEIWNPVPPVVPPTHGGGKFIVANPHCLVYGFSGEVTQDGHGHPLVRLQLQVCRAEPEAQNRCRGPIPWRGFLPGNNVGIQITCNVPGRWDVSIGNQWQWPSNGNRSTVWLGPHDFTVVWELRPSRGGNLEFVATFASGNEPAPIAPVVGGLTY